MLQALRWLAVIATIGMGIVLLQGTLVTNTNSAYGCGSTWPLCHGKLIPEFRGLGAVATMIEFSHRAVVPIESALILVLTAGALWYHGRRREIQVLAPAMIFFLFLQAVLGGLAVLYPTSAGILALHFGISLMAFASIMLTASVLLEIDGVDAIRDRPMPGSLRLVIWGSMLYTYLEVYLGAYVRHAGASLSCLDWPLCNGNVIPRFVTGVAPQFGHRVGALGAVALLCWMLALTWGARQSRPDLFRAARIAVLLVVLQGISGGFVVLTKLSIASTLVHSGLIMLLFGVQSYLCLHTISRPARAHNTQPTTKRQTRAAPQSA